MAEMVPIKMKVPFSVLAGTGSKSTNEKQDRSNQQSAPPKKTTKKTETKPKS